MNVRPSTSPTPPSRRWLIVWVAALSLFVGLAIAVSIRSPLPGEVAVMREVQSWPIAGLAHAGILLGEVEVTIGVGALATIVLAVARRYDLALIAAASFLRVLSTPMKDLVGRARPTADLVRVDEITDTLAFPSGHAFGATLCWGALAVIAWRTIHGRSRYPVVVLLVGIPLLTGIGRVYVGAHWPTDVVGGWLFGPVLIMAVAASARFVMGQNGPLDRMGSKNDGSHT
jgi:membrane-associated phospholipid phosphatase